MPLQRIDGLISFSDHFEIERDALSVLAAFDPLLDVDLPYAIDPKLLTQSEVPEMAAAHEILLDRYRSIYLLLKASAQAGDRPWREAERLVNFPEFRGPCLGFSAGTAAGHGWGPAMRDQVLHSAKEIIDLGISDPTFFELIGVFEDGIGPDLISDMIGTILLDPLAEFTRRVCAQLLVPTQEFFINNRSYRLPGYLPEQGDRARYIILVPEDVLSEMPVALDKSGVAAVAEHSAKTREYLNFTVGKDWRELSERKKSVTRAALLTDGEVFKEFLERYDRRSAEAYDFGDDPRNLRLWYTLARLFLEEGSIPELVLPTPSTAEDVLATTKSIVNEFKRNVEHNGLWQLFYNDDGTARRESIIQRTFQAVAQAYCNANNLDLSVEPNAGRGPVDFKVSQGALARVLIELKRSKSTKLVQGYRAQVAAYASAENTTGVVYVVVDFGEEDAKMNALYDEYEADRLAGRSRPFLIVVEAWRHKSGSRA